MQAGTSHKERGAYYTPRDVACSLSAWARRGAGGRLLDPSCGDGRFLEEGRRAVGVEMDPGAAAEAEANAPTAEIHRAEFFEWSGRVERKFDAVVGNPPFIRFQKFNASARAAADRALMRIGVSLPRTASSWAAFILVAADLIETDGRMAMVVPEEISYTRYGAATIRALAERFRSVGLLAVREKIFPDISENCWLLFADGRGGRSDDVGFARRERFDARETPPEFEFVPLAEVERDFGGRLRPLLLPKHGREAYARMKERATALGEVARVNLGYVTGANGFFHLRPSDLARWGIPIEDTTPAIRNIKDVPSDVADERLVTDMSATDAPFRLLLPRADSEGDLAPGLRAYLDREGEAARSAYKCRNRSPWWRVPDVKKPDFLLACMSTDLPRLARNAAGFANSNAVHGVFADCPDGWLERRWNTAGTRLSCEVEGHPLGGGMLKVEPSEARRIRLSTDDTSELDEIRAELKRWRSGK